MTTCRAARGEAILANPDRDLTKSAQAGRFLPVPWSFEPAGLQPR